MAAVRVRPGAIVTQQTMTALLRVLKEGKEVSVEDAMTTLISKRKDSGMAVEDLRNLRTPAVELIKSNS